MKKVIYMFMIVVFGFACISAQAAGLAGDANGNGTVDIVDALMAARYYVGMSTGIDTTLADVNGDGSVTIVDALLIAQYYVGIITGFPVQTQAVQLLKSGVAHNENPVAATGELEALVAGNTAFAVDMYGAVSGGNDNLIFSPHSISSAFGMCSAGARGQTGTEIANVLHFTLDQSRLHNAMNVLDARLASSESVPTDGSTGQVFKLRIANSVWGQKDYPFVQAYLDTLAVNYDAGMNLLDFKLDPEKSRVTINTWVEDNTEQKIKDLLPQGSIDTLTRMVLTNAIYFKASWYMPFKPENTVPGTFVRLDGTSVTAQMMNRQYSMPGKEVAGEYQIIAIPYYNRLTSMVIILPATGKFRAIESSLTAATLASMTSSLTTKVVTLSMPKFNFEWSTSLAQMLQGLGMAVPFSPSAADFSGITTYEQLFISDVLHKAVIGVDEQGTEAAAATAIIMSTTGLPDYMTVNMNRPFIFLVRDDRTGAILFMGRVLQP